MQLPDRRALLGGLAGLAVWGLGVGLTAAGVVLPPLTVAGIALTSNQELGFIVAIVGSIATHVAPTSIKKMAADLNTDVERLAPLIPYLQYDTEAFPGGFPHGPQSPNNLQPQKSS